MLKRALSVIAVFFVVVMGLEGVRAYFDWQDEKVAVRVLSAEIHANPFDVGCQVVAKERYQGKWWFQCEGQTWVVDVVLRSVISVKKVN